MTCAVEMLRCDRCGDEVLRASIYIVTDDEGQRHWLCEGCHGEVEQDR